jgi:hypothetical protein
VKAEIAHGISLADAAYAAGFADQSHMTRHFKSRFGLTPGRYAALCASEAFGNDPLEIAWDHTPRTTVNGTSRPFPSVVANVALPNRQRAFSWKSGN